MKLEFDFQNLSDKELEQVEITFTPKRCPKCKEFMLIRKLGVWGYYCLECAFWWGVYEPFPKVRSKLKK